MDAEHKPGWFLPGVLLAGALAYTLFPGSAPLDLVRPGSEQKRTVRAHRLESVPARLWEDPLRALQRATDDVPAHSVATPIPVQLPPRTGASEELELDGEALVLAIMVPGGPTGVDSENRKRTRYAALTSAGVEGYVPTEPGHLGVFAYEHEPATDVPVHVPFEMLEWAPFLEGTTPAGTRDTKRILLLWVGENRMGDAPLAFLHGLLEAIPTPADERPRYAIIGPTSSDGLAAMLKDEAGSTAHSDEPCAFDGAPWVSSWATISDEELFGLLPEDSPFDREWMSAPKSTLPCGLEFHRLIQPDEHLIDLLLAELDARGLGDETIALITEWDSSYARLFLTAFRRKMGEDKRVKPFFYASGLDGVLPGIGSDPAGTRSGDDPSAGPASDPVGRKQTDYLRRLESKLADEGTSFRAIGIVGSDVYDKLLVLRALRPQFPKAVFFTTDLDAQFLASSEHEWTSNVVVASHFGLDPNSDPGDLVPGTLPFRDSYQTSNYLACRRVLQLVGNGNAERRPTAIRSGNYSFLGNVVDALLDSATVEASEPLGATNPASIYEIGRGRAYLLSRAQERVPALPLQWDVLACLCGAALAGMRAVRPRPRHAKLWWGLTLVMSALAVVELALGHWDAGLTVVLGWVALALAGLGATLRAYASMYRRVVISGQSPRLRAELVLFGAPWACVAVLVLEAIMILGARQDQQEPLSFFVGISAWPAIFVRLFVFFGAVASVLFLSSRLHEREKKISEAFGLKEEPVRSCTLPAPFQKFLGTGGPKSLRRRVPHQPNTTDLDRVWLWYQDRSSRRILRSTPAALLFSGVILALYLLDGPAGTARGSVARWAHGLTWVLSLSTVAMLLFFVLDATLLCYRFIGRAVSSDDGLEWPTRARGKLLQGLAPRGPHESQDVSADIETKPYLDRLWDVRFFSALTEDIGGLVWLPFAFLFALVLAQSTVFENWSWSPFSIALLLVNVVMLIVAAALLRSSAERLRAKAAEQLRDQQLNCKLGRKATRLDELEHALQEVLTTKRGAFLPFAHHPIATALLLPFGGVGTLAVLEHLLL